jgi:hypothetical protein
MKIIPLPFETVALTGWTHKVSIFAADLTAAATTQTFTIFPDGSADGYYSNGAAIQDGTLNQLPAGFQVEKSQIRVAAVFTGTGITAVQISVGDKANTARYIASANTDLLTAIGLNGTNTKDNVASATTYAFASADVTNGNAQLQAVITATGGNVTLLAASGGQVDILLALADPNEQATVTGT